MADIKISELSETTDLNGLYTIGTDKNNSSKKVALQFIKDAADYANAQGDYAKQAGDTVNGNVGVSDYPEFSASKSYVIGDIVRYNGVLYSFTANHAASAWNGSDVKATSINAITSGKLTELESATNTKIAELESTVNAFGGLRTTKIFENVKNNSSLSFPLGIPKGFTFKFSFNADANVGGYLGVEYSDDTTQNDVVPSFAPGKIVEYTSDKDIKSLILFLYGNVSSPIGDVEVIIDIIGFADNINDLSQKLNSEIESTDADIKKLELSVKGQVYSNEFKDVQAAQTFGIPFFVPKGETLKISFISNIATGCYVGVSFADGTSKNDVVPSFGSGSSAKYVAEQDVKVVNLFMTASVSVIDVVSVELSVDGVEHSVTRLESETKLQISNLQTEVQKINNSIYESVTEKSVSVKYSTQSVGLDGIWAKGTKVYLLADSADTSFSRIYYGMTYPSGYVQNIANAAKGNVIEYTMTEDCSKISMYIDGITNAGTIVVKATTEDIWNFIRKNLSKNNFRGLSLSILGDSYSTYGGWIGSNAPWYAENGIDGNNTQENNVSDVSQTWWYQLCEETGMKLLKNDSYSGATICNIGYSGGNSSASSFITRMKNSLGQVRALENKPNIIFVFGGTNDSWANSPIGELKYSDWSEEDLNSVLPSICYMFSYIRKWNPGAMVVNLVNTGLKTDIVNGFAAAANHYGVYNLVLDNIGKESGHPNQQGMSDIKNQIISYLNEIVA